MKYSINFDLALRTNPYTGLYIALEGIDGSGKTTQAKKLQEYFEKQGREVIVTSEPRVTLFLGEQIMKVFTSEVSIPPVAFQHVLTANRLINMSEIVEPALQAGKVVITDRSFWSALAYGLMDAHGSYERSEADRMLMTQSVLSHYHQSIVPDKTFYIRISSDVAIERLKTRKGREKDIYEKKDKLETVVKGYDWLIKEFPQELTLVDGEQQEEQVSLEISKHLAMLKEKRP